MEITGITLTADNPDPVVLAFRDPNNVNPFQVKDITGMDTDDIIKQYYGSGDSGNLFHDLRLIKREMVIDIGLNPLYASDDDFPGLRDRIYRLVSSSRSGNITINFMQNEFVAATITGTVSKVEASYFNKSPDVKLTIVCLDPMLRAPSPLVVPLPGLTSRTIHQHGVDVVYTVLTDDFSTAPHGINYSVRFTSNHSSFTIAGLDWFFEVDYPFQADDILRIENDLGPKFISLQRGDTYIQIADRIAENSIWAVIFPGENLFNISNYTQWNHIEYTLTYWGV